MIEERKEEALTDRNRGDLRLVTIFWGDGKGKTTAALGMAVRALGHGFRVHLIQFLKGGPTGTSLVGGELKALEGIEGFSVERFEASEWIVGELTPEQNAAVQKALDASERAISSGEYDLVILDEILYAIPLKILTVEDILGLLRQKALRTGVILTGSWQRLPEVEEVADLVTEVKKVKHPYDKGITARKGVEF